jgi:RNA polymerase sigma-70 factor (ECF subfamily)
MELLPYVNGYRFTAATLQERTNMADVIYFKIEPSLRLFIFAKVPPSEIDDIMQEILVAVFQNLDKFNGKTDKEFWKWCYQIARNKISDMYRKKKSSRLEPLPVEELWPLVEESAGWNPISPQDRLDLEHAMNLLSESKPECRFSLWEHYVVGLDFSEMAIELGLEYDAMRRRIERCLTLARKLIAA